MPTRGRAKAQMRHGKACQRKVRYEDRRAAQQAADKIAERQNERVNVYACSCCRGWHVGKTPTWRRADSA